MSQITRASIFSFSSSFPELEKAASKAGLPFCIIRSREEWLAHPQGKLLDSLPIAPIEKIGDAPPKPFPSNGARPLEGIKVLLLAKAIAGPSCGRTLAEHGADVLIIVSDHGVEHEWIHNSAYLGCRSAFLNFGKPKDMETMWKLVEEADVFVEASTSYSACASLYIMFSSWRTKPVTANYHLANVTAPSQFLSLRTSALVPSLNSASIMKPSSHATPISLLPTLSATVQPAH